MVDVDERTQAPTRASVWSEAADAFARWRQGDAAALDDLVRVLTPVLWHVVRAYGLEREQAEDVVQTTWLKLVRGADSVHDGQAIGGWLTTTARREAWRQSAARAKAPTPVADEIVFDRVPPGPSAESEAVARDEQARLWEGVGQLNERCQRLLRVIAFSPRPNYTALADELGMPIGSIGPTRGRCLDKLRALLTEPIEGGSRVSA